MSCLKRNHFYGFAVQDLTEMSSPWETHISATTLSSTYTKEVDFKGDLGPWRGTQMHAQISATQICQLFLPCACSMKANFKQICINGSSLINSGWGSFYISTEQDTRVKCKSRDLISSLVTQWAVIQWEQDLVLFAFFISGVLLFSSLFFFLFPLLLALPLIAC